MIGTTIADRYEVRSAIAVGAMATVFLGRQLGLQRDVAIKVLDPSLARIDNYAARFEREAHSLSRLDHPNCLRVFDYGTSEGGLPFLITELIDGVELAALMTARTEAAVAVERTLQILAGLEHAHSCGLVHRDLKPENILVVTDAGGSELLKIVDFGIAKVVSSPAAAALTAANVVFGTPQYMSPEQASGVDVDHRSDLYAAGVLLYAMLVGHVPFDGDDPIAVSRRQIHEQPAPLPDEISPALRAFVLRLLAKDRQERFGSASEAMTRLQKIGAGAGESPTRELAPTSVQPEGFPAAPASRRMGAVLMAATGVAVVFGVVAGSATQCGDVADEPTDPMAEMTHEDADRLLARGEAPRAHEVLSTLLDESPDAPELLWSDGRALSAMRQWDRALNRYAGALAADPQLESNPSFFAELDVLMRRPELEHDAIDVALRSISAAADRFLLDIVNRDRRPLQYVERNRILAHLLSSDVADHIDVRHNAYLDLRQAASAPEPCAAYDHGLQVIEGDETAPPDPAILRRYAVPDNSAGEEAEVCTEAEGRRQRLLAVSSILEVIDSASAEPAQD